jgi:peptidoglycan/xylan/chitin deacetylase (PgdA/CDA1 family)
MIKTPIIFLSFALLFCAAPKTQAIVFFSQGAVSSKKIALTFDDGPGKSTAKILDILKDKNVKATFFLIGERARRFPKLAERIALEGHEIANHTFAHVNFYLYQEPDKQKALIKEIILSEDEIIKAVGLKPRFVRFPYGYNASEATEAAKLSGYAAVVNWSYGIDWNHKLPARRMYEGYKKNISKGAIFLMHDSKDNKKLLSFLPQLIDDIRKSGYEIVPLSELLNVAGEQKIKLHPIKGLKLILKH